MTRDEIIEIIAKEGRIEQMVKNISHKSVLSPDLKDLSQMVFLIVMEYSDSVIEDLWAKGEMNFFLVRIIMTQLHSPRSTYNYTFHHRRTIDADISDIYEAYDKEAE